jgi:hypothetical protein
MDKILTFIKKYTSLLIPAGIALCALLLLIPTLLIGGSLKEKIIKSERQGNLVGRSVNTNHSKKDVIDAKYYQDQLEADSKRVVDLARQATQRELISHAIFPEPDDSSGQIYTDFGTDYRVAIEELLRRANARSAPTTSEIKQQLANRGNVKKQGGGAGYYKPKRKGRGSDAYELTKDAFLKKRAQEMSFYATAKVFEWYPFWKKYTVENQNSAVEDCWYSQISYWVYEDVIETVKAINSGSSTVFNSGVKRLVGVSFQKNADYLRESGRGGIGGRANNRKVSGDPPEYVVNATAAGIFGFGPWTGRICDEKIDVIHFNVAVVIGADSVFPFLKELCSEKEHTYKGYLKNQKPVTYKRNQITVLQYWQEPINKLAREHERYRYGDNTVVKLNLTCEYILNRSGYNEVKPTVVVDKLKEDIEAAASGKNKR